MTTYFKGFDVADGAASIPPGRYAGVVRDIEQMFAKTTGDPFLVWRCVVEVDGVDVEVDGSSSLNTTPKSKPRRWMRAVLGREIDRGEHIAKADLVGHPCVIDVEVNDDGWPFVADIRPTGPLTSARLAPTSSFAEAFAAKSAAAQAEMLGTTPPVADVELPF